MGKNKAQRTKNNVKPSNSGRSAELLGAAVPGFVGFSATKDGGYIPVLPGLSINSLNEVDITAIDADFHVSIKKMHKKDVTTKVKGLREFADLCNDSPFSSVESVIPVWPRIYCMLAVDTENRVREGAQLAHAALVKKAGKNIATYLKQLAGHWFTSQFDTYPPASSIAANSFQETFAEKKYVDAIVYCQDEILSYIRDTINMQSLQSNNNKPATESSNSIETNSQRILISCLQAYGCYLKNVPFEHMNKVIAIHKHIIGNKKFWAFSKHEFPLIKIAFFNILTLMIENAIDLIKLEKKRIITTVIDNLDEADPRVICAVWECLLTVISKIDDWHTIINIEKLLLPKLRRVLQSGGLGCANVIYPALLPLIHQFPKFNLDSKSLFIDFFDSMCRGIKEKTVQTSRSEITTITKSFFECFRYIILLNSNDINFCKKLITEVLMTTIESYIRDYSSIKAIIFDELSELIRYWSKNRESPEAKCYIELTYTFWNELELMFQRFETIKNRGDCKLPVNIHEVAMKLLISLKNPHRISHKNAHVKFEDSNNVSVNDQTAASTSCENEVYYKELYKFIHKLCIKYFNYHEENTISTNVEILSCLISHYNSELLFNEIVKSYNYRNLVDIYNYKLKPYLTVEGIETATIIEIIFTLFKYMSDEEKYIVLYSLTELNNSLIMDQILIYGFTSDYLHDKSMKKWRKTHQVTEHLHKIVRKFTNDSLNSTHEYILLQIFEISDDDSSVSEESINDIVNIIGDTLMRLVNITTKIIEFSYQLLRLMWAHKRLINDALKILEILFQLSISESLPSNLKDLLLKNWKNEFHFIYEKIPNSELINVQMRCMQKLYVIISSSDEPCEIIVDIAQNLIECSNGNNNYKAINMLLNVNHDEKSNVKILLPEVINIIFYAEIVTGNLYLVNPMQCLPSEIQLTALNTYDTEKIPNQLLKCLKWSLLSVTIFNNLLEKLNNTNSADEINKFIDNNVSSIFNMLDGILFVASSGKLYCDHYRFVNNYDDVIKVHNQLEDQCYRLRDLLPKNEKLKMFSEFIDSNNYWVKYGSIFSEYLQYFNGNYSHLSEIKSQTVKTLKNYLTSDEPSLTHTDHTHSILLARNLLEDINKNNDLSLQLLVRLIENHKSDKNFLLLDEDMSSISWEQFYVSLEIIRLITKLINIVPNKLNKVVWDFVMISLPSWQLILDRYKYLHDDLKLQCFTVALSHLFCAVQSVMNNSTLAKDNNLLLKLMDEWQNVFAESVNQEMIKIWMYYGQISNTKTNNLKSLLTLNYVGDAVKLVNGSIFFEDKTNTTKAVTPEQLINFSVELLLSPVACLQLSAHYVINSLIPMLVKQDEILIDEGKLEDEKMSIKYFIDALSSVQKVINTMLEDFKLCDTVSCIVQPYTDSYTYTMGYFLIWMNILKMCEISNADVRYQYAETFKNEYFTSLMNNILRLIPSEVFQNCNLRIPTAKFTKMFKTSPNFNFHDNLTIWKLDHIVCWMYISCLRHLPVLTRQWWNTIESRVSNVVEKMTVLYVSPILCQEELSDSKLSNFANLQIKIHPAVREVTAHYQMDDTKLVLNIILPTNYPLEPVTVRPGHHKGNAINWKNCHMQLSLFLSHQNGSLWDGLMMWKKNLDKKFAGVEECYICFSIFHINSYQIPKLSCQTCRKKFHAPCLYKWFSTSQKSTCPICRNVF